MIKNLKNTTTEFLFFLVLLIAIFIIIGIQFVIYPIPFRKTEWWANWLSGLFFGLLIFWIILKIKLL